MGLFFVVFWLGVCLKALVGGEKPKCNLPCSLAFLVPPHFAGMAVLVNPKRGRSLLAFTAAIKMLKNRRRHAARKMEALGSIYKGGGRSPRALETQQKNKPKNYKKKLV